MFLFIFIVFSFIFLKRFCSKKILYILIKRMDRHHLRNGNNNYGMVFGVILFILLLFVLFGTCTETGRSFFKNIRGSGSGSGSGDVKEMDIVMFMSPTCPWCKKMLEVIKKDGHLSNITMVDITKPEGQNMAKQYGADKQPVPSFISRKTKTGTVGYRESMDELLKALAPGSTGGGKMPTGGDEPGPESQGGSGDLQGLAQSLKIILFSREGCPWCQKAKDNLSESGVSEIVQVVDITTPEGQQMAGELLPPDSSGVPAFVSLATKKSVIGFKPIEQIVQELQ